jgi:hypothetical protein
MHRVVDGRMTFHFYLDRLEKYGIYLSSVDETIKTPDPTEMNIEPPRLSFDITDESDLTFYVEKSVFISRDFIEGNIRLDGGLTFVVEETEAEWPMQDFVLSYMQEERDVPPGEPVLHVLHIRNGDEESPFILDLTSVRAGFKHHTRELVLDYLEIAIREDWASAMGRPELAGKLIGIAEVYGRSEPVREAETERDE